MIVDSHCMAGFWPLQRRDLSRERLLRFMDRHQVQQACLVSAKAFIYDFVEGNEETLRWCAQQERFLPVAVIDPRRYLECLAEILSARERGFRMFRLFADHQHWQADWPSFRRLPEVFSEVKLPVAAPPEIGLGALAGCLPDLQAPVILSGLTYWNLADGLALMEQHRNVYVDTSLLNSPGAVELVCQEFGPERLIFGSGALLNHMAPPLQVIAHTQMDEAAKAAVLGGNLEGMMGG